MDELFDIVDAEDCVIAQAPRSAAHRGGLRHRATHVWILGPNKRMLIQLRSALKDVAPLAWDSSACGHLNAGEDYLPAAIRETREELGIDLPAGSLDEIARISACPETGMEFVRLYATHHPGPFMPPAREIAALRWVSPAELNSWMERDPKVFARSFIYLWQNYRNSPKISMALGRESGFLKTKAFARGKNSAFF
jgi:16S rRNA (adenine1518-N6/adenine1519-N6)-dimethyltransferase